MLRFLLLSTLTLSLLGCGDDIGPPTRDGGGEDADNEGCAPGEVRCGSRCVNRQSDARNCGMCGNECESGSFCNMGLCDRNCSSGLMACGSSCVDVATDREHCMRCDNACREDQACRGGGCACPEGFTECGGTCLDPDTDPMNCGVCDRTCDADQACRNGMCTCPAGESELECNDMLDDDCDGMVDCDDPDCVDQTRPCMVGGCGGVETCQSDMTWGMCIGGEGVDICGDGIDQDCDGSDLRNPDMYEPNDTCTDCNLVTMQEDPNVTITARFDSVEDRVDCYRFVVDDEGGLTAIEEIEVTLSDIPTGHNYDIYLYRGADNCNGRVDDPGGRSVTAGNADEMIRWSEPFFFSEDGGTWYVRVVRVTGQSCEDDYTLQFNGMRDLP